MELLAFLLMVLVFLGVTLGGSHLIAITIVRRLIKPKGQTMKSVAYVGTFACGFLLIMTVIGLIAFNNVGFGR